MQNKEKYSFRIWNKYTACSMYYSAGQNHLVHTACAVGSKREDNLVENDRVRNVMWYHWRVTKGMVCSFQAMLWHVKACLRDGHGNLSINDFAGNRNRGINDSKCGNKSTELLGKSISNAFLIFFFGTMSIQQQTDNAFYIRFWEFKISVTNTWTL